jgi:hypothetical protein
MEAAGRVDPARLRALLLALIAAGTLASQRDWSPIK